MNKGQKLLRKAKKIIPGGNQLLSKRSEMFLPGLWPAYYKKAKGCKVWDLNNKMYYDFVMSQDNYRPDEKDIRYVLSELVTAESSLPLYNNLLYLLNPKKSGVHSAVKFLATS